jgi:mono/diheme cytochrome c family protein/plastocyanin
MSRRELAARCAVFLIIVGFPLGVLAYHRGDRPLELGGVKVIELTARAPASGGWQPEVITVNQGDRVRLRITAIDVVHGFAIGHMDVGVDRILPGETVEVEFEAEQAGRFTYYCNVWCDPYHYRMRGTLVVEGQGSPDPSADLVTPDLAEMDLDAPHEARFYPLERPSAARGEVVYRRAFGGGTAPPIDTLREQSPGAVYQSLVEGRLPGGAESAAAPSLTTDDTWDLVSYLWSLTTTPERLDVGSALYAKNCAACHGEAGTGDGPGSLYTQQTTTDFTDPATMTGGSGALYLAKTRRGGMGTGMPYFGPIFTDDELSAVVDYLWTFLFSYGGTPREP